MSNHLKQVDVWKPVFSKWEILETKHGKWLTLLISNLFLRVHKLNDTCKVLWEQEDSKAYELKEEGGKMGTPKKLQINIKWEITENG